ncbi:hypothetical protein [Streptomyces sp. ITFR-16]|uniref:hypothetical protein n=1 Tax=Streptomyces sp. ITFR-16 TaxID=3075198 RepID=UPI002889D690|nr:hypothetical protein [Streptomyces sp. ITFR-16]WNI21954.1 hypothetical protein RLT58_08380 [Streptomyces sp. ITFR-16]
MTKGGTSIPDEEWERFLQDAEAGTPGAPEEPSARARMVARRLREEPGPPGGWRTHEPPRRRRGKGWYVVGFLVVVALFVVASDPGRVTNWFGGDDGGGTTRAAEPERPDAPPATGAAFETPTPDDPFRGSPADAWKDGVAGITLPAARATGWMSEKDVARTLERSRDFLVASNLDPGVLRGERPAAAIALLNPRQKDVQNYLAHAFDTPSRKNDPLKMFSRFAPSKVRLVGDAVRTRGWITFRKGERGAVEVTSDVTYVYPVVRAAEGSDEVARTVVRRETVMSWDDPSKVIIEPGTFSLVSYKADTANGGCDNVSGFFVPEFPSDRRSTGEGPEVDPYERGDSMDQHMASGTEGQCREATRL